MDVPMGTAFPPMMPRTPTAPRTPLAYIVNAQHPLLALPRHQPGRGLRSTTRMTRTETLALFPQRMQGLRRMTQCSSLGDVHRINTPLFRFPVPLFPLRFLPLPSSLLIIRQTPRRLGNINIILMRILLQRKEPLDLTPMQRLVRRAIQTRRLTRRRRRTEEDLVVYLFLFR